MLGRGVKKSEKVLKYVIYELSPYPVKAAVRSIKKESISWLTS